MKTLQATRVPLIGTFAEAFAGFSGSLASCGNAKIKNVGLRHTLPTGSSTARVDM